MQGARFNESMEQQKNKVILIPGITMFDRVYSHTKEVLEAGGDLDGVPTDEIRSKVLEAEKIVGDLAREQIKENNPENRFVPDAGAESRLIAAGRVFSSMSSNGLNPEIYVTGGKETNTVEEELFRSQIMKSHLVEKEHVPVNSVVDLTSAGNTKGNMESFLSVVEQKHDLKNTEVYLITDERHLPRSTVMLILAEYKRINGTELVVTPEFIDQEVCPILDRFCRYKDTDKLTAEETSLELMRILSELTGNLEVSIIPKSSADVMENTANMYDNPGRDVRYAKTLKGDPYNWPHREEEVKGIKDILLGAYKAGSAGSTGKK